MTVLYTHLVPTEKCGREAQFQAEASFIALRMNAQMQVGACSPLSLCHSLPLSCVCAFCTRVTVLYIHLVPTEKSGREAQFQSEASFIALRMNAQMQVTA